MNKEKVLIHSSAKTLHKYIYDSKHKATNLCFVLFRLCFEKVKKKKKKKIFCFCMLATGVKVAASYYNILIWVLP